MDATAAAAATLLLPLRALSTISSLSLSALALAALEAGCAACCCARWPARARRAALLVIAHPDDEAMFFAPTLRALAASGASVRILCLSDGSPSGGCRAGELRRSAATLGVPPDRVAVLAFRDGMAERWDVGQAAAAVAAAAAALDPPGGGAAALVVSFDAGGVTGHANHVSTAHAVALFARAPHAPPCYALETVGPLRRFVRLGDVARSAALHAWRTWPWRGGGERAAPAHVMVAIATPLAAHVAMREHASQFVWHRVLFVWCSTYATVNTLRLLPGPPPPVVMPAAPTREKQT
jgi:N-acetylglucosaminylphosphatidylinositol deacetylase